MNGRPLSREVSPCSPLELALNVKAFVRPFGRGGGFGVYGAMKQGEREMSDREDTCKGNGAHQAVKDFGQYIPLRAVC